MHPILCAISEPLLDGVFAWADSLVWCFCVVVLFFLFEMQCLELAVIGEVDPRPVRSTAIRSNGHISSHAPINTAQGRGTPWTRAVWPRW